MCIASSHEGASVPRVHTLGQLIDLLDRVPWTDDILIPRNRVASLGIPGSLSENLLKLCNRIQKTMLKSGGGHVWIPWQRRLIALTEKGDGRSAESSPGLDSDRWISCLSPGAGKDSIRWFTNLRCVSTGPPRASFDWGLERRDRSGLYLPSVLAPSLDASPPLWSSATPLLLSEYKIQKLDLWLVRKHSWLKKKLSSVIENFKL